MCAQVPVVATVIQRVLEDGQLVIEVEPPQGEQLQQTEDLDDDLQDELLDDEEAETTMIEEIEEEEEAEEEDEEEDYVASAQFIKTEVEEQGIIIIYLVYV